MGFESLDKPRSPNGRVVEFVKLCDEWPGRGRGSCKGLRGVEPSRRGDDPTEDKSERVGGRGEKGVADKVPGIQFQASRKSGGAGVRRVSFENKFGETVVSEFSFCVRSPRL